MSGFRIRGGPIEREKVIQPVEKPEPQPKIDYKKMEMDEYEKKLKTIKEKEKVVFENGVWKIVK
jgi:hypothetical protein